LPGKEEEPSDLFWLGTLPSLLIDGDNGPKENVHKAAGFLLDILQTKTRQQMSLVQNQLEELVNGFNRLSNSELTLKPLHITSASLTTPAANGESAEFPRYRLTSGSLCLIVVCSLGKVEIYELPADQLYLADGQAGIEKRRLSWSLQEKKNTWFWYADALPLDSSTRTVLIKQLFCEFVKAAWSRRREGVQTKTLSHPSLERSEAITLKSLIQEKQNLVNKLLSRDEELTSAIARDLHDVIIADIMLLKSRLNNDPDHTSKEEIIRVLDQLTKSLREICYNLTPRDLADWGLKTVLEDLAHQFSKQNETPCTFKCEEDLPTVEHAVQLQIYRIVQEGLNNVAKYAEAKNVSISLAAQDGIFRIAVVDDGNGFEVDEVALRRSAYGGSGLHDLRERTDLIRCFHPAKLAIISAPGKGTTVSLEINYRLN